MNDKFPLVANGLKLTHFPSRTLTINEIDDIKFQDHLKEHFETAYVVLWLDNEVMIGLWKDEKFVFSKNKTFDFKYVQRLRAFDNDKEIHIWRSGGQWNGRVRIDKDAGNDTDVVIAHQLLFGTKGKNFDSQFIEIKEDRGTKLILPIADFHFDEKGDPQSRIFIKTYNYVTTNKIGQATYFDCRFVAFTDSKKEIV